MWKAGMHIYSRGSAKGKRVQASKRGTNLRLLLEVCACFWNSANYLSDCLWLFQSNMGAKNHAIVLPDASIDATLNALVAAGFGAAGQRCMALSTVVFVGDSKLWYYSYPWNLQIILAYITSIYSAFMFLFLEVKLSPFSFGILLFWIHIMQFVSWLLLTSFCCERLLWLLMVRKIPRELKLIF